VIRGQLRDRTSNDALGSLAAEELASVHLASRLVDHSKVGNGLPQTRLRSVGIAGCESPKVIHGL